MRVAVHFPDGAVAAYHLGRIEDGVHNKLWHTGETVPIDEFVGSLTDRARAEYPGCEIVLERLVDNGDGTSRWVQDPTGERPAEAGVTHEHEAHVSQDAGASAGGVA